MIDAPRHTDFHQTPLFARRLVHSAGCPVVIVPPAIAEQTDTEVATEGTELGRSLLDATGTRDRPGVRPAATSE